MESSEAGNLSLSVHDPFSTNSESDYDPAVDLNLSSDSSENSSQEKATPSRIKHKRARLSEDNASVETRISKNAILDGKFFEVRYKSVIF